MISHALCPVQYNLVSCFICDDCWRHLRYLILLDRCDLLCAFILMFSHVLMSGYCGRFVVKCQITGSC